MSESKIEQELLSIVSLKAKKNEDRQKYLARLMLAVDKASDEDWNSLSTDAQAWNNDAATAYKEQKDIADFSDIVEEAPKEVIDEETGEVINVEDIPEATEEDFARAKLVKPEESKEEEPAAEEEAPRKSRTKRSGKPSACRLIKQMVLTNPKITVGDIAEKLKVHRMKVSDVTIYTLRYDIRDTLRAMNDLGMAEFDI